MITIATFDNPIEAQLLITRLRGEGIEAFARDDLTVSMNAFASHAFGGVKVDVADDEAEKAVRAMTRPAADPRTPPAEQQPD